MQLRASVKAIYANCPTRVLRLLPTSATFAYGLRTQHHVGIKSFLLFSLPAQTLGAKLKPSIEISHLPAPATSVFATEISSRNISGSILFISIPLPSSSHTE